MSSPSAPANSSEEFGIPARAPGAYRTFIALTAAHFLADCFGGIWPVYVDLAGLDLAIAGRIATAVGMLGTATEPFFGLWADRRGRRGFIVVGTAMTFAAMFLGPVAMLIGRPDGGGGRVGAVLPMSVAYAMMFTLMMITRVGQDMFHPAGAGLAGGFSPAHRSTFVAVFVALGATGFALSQGIFSAVYLLASRHTELLLIPGLLLWVLIYAWCRPPHSAGSRAVTLRAVLADLRSAGGGLFILFLILSFSAAVNIALYFLLPKFIAARGYPAWMARGGAYGCLVIGSVFMMVPMGHLATRFGRRPMLILMLLLAAVSYHAVVRSPQMPVWLFIGLCLVAGGFLGTVNPMGIAFGQHLSPRNVSMVSALMMGVAWCVGSISPSIVGPLAKRIGPIDTLAWVGVLNVLMVALGFLLPGEKPRAPAASPAAGPPARL